MHGQIVEGHNIGKIVGYDDMSSITNTLKALVQVGNKVFEIDYDPRDGEYDMLKLENPVGSTVIVEYHRGEMIIESL